MADGHGGKRSGAGRPPGTKNPVYKPMGWLAPPSQGGMRIDAVNAGRPRRKQLRVNPFKPAGFPPGALPEGFERSGGFAQDKAIEARGKWALDDATEQLFGLSGWPTTAMGGAAIYSQIEEGQVWLGYPLLSILAQRSEYRTITETIAEECTRKWIRFQSKSSDEPPTEDELADEADIPEGQENEATANFEGTSSSRATVGDADPALGGGPAAAPGEGPPGGGDPVEPAVDPEEEAEEAEREAEREARAEKKRQTAERIKQLEEEFERLGVRKVFYEALTHDGWFGSGPIYLEIGRDGEKTYDSREELITDVGTGWNDVSEGKVSGEIKLQRLWNVEPAWVYPQRYNSSDPLAPDWYRPSEWYVMSRPIHASRLLRVVGREVPDMLKPAYAFGGLSMTQIAKPYVDNWLRTRQSVSDLVAAFTVFGLKTDLATALQSDGEQLYRRAKLFTDFRDNHGLLLVQSGPEGQGEEFFNVSAPLGSLDKLQDQAQGQMCSVVRIPVVKLLGIQPSGLNASSEGEIRTFYDHIHAYQERVLRDPIRTVLGFVMLGLWGEVDEEIDFDFEPLLELTDKEEGELRKSEAETDKILVDTGVLHPEEVRRRIANDPDTPYADIDVTDVPDLKQEEQQGLMPGGKGLGGGGGPGGEGEGGGEEPAEDRYPRLAFSRDQRIARDQRAGPFDARGRAPPKWSKADQAYRPSYQPRGGTRCDTCTMWRPPHGCSAVDGTIYPEDLCDLYDPQIPSPLATDEVEWREHEHPRDEGGKFSSGGGGTGSGKFKAPQFGLPYGAASESDDLPLFSSKPKGKPELKMGELTKVGGQLGSNPGASYEDRGGRRYYIKAAKSPAHAKNEVMAGALYELAGAPTIKYRPVEGGNHVATEWEHAEKSSAKQFTPAEKKKAQEDFGVHAWLANWDAAGLDYDNQVVINGKPTSVDLGGALEYRAQGAPKGDKFGNEVGEWSSMRDKRINPQNADLFGGMMPEALQKAAEKVDKIPDEDIRRTVLGNGGTLELAEKLVARKYDLAQKAGLYGDPASPEGAAIFGPGTGPVDQVGDVPFAPWEPPEDWATVDGQAEIDEPPLEAPRGKEAASGLLMREPDGRVWMVRPKGGYGGYDHTFAKGRIEEGLSPQANAIKEAYEETGLKGRIVGLAGDYPGDVTMTRYYLAEREGGDPRMPGEEAGGVVLAPPDMVDRFLNRSRDKKIVQEQFGQDEWVHDEFREADHPRDEGGKFSETAGGGSSAATESEKSSGPSTGETFKSKKDHVARLLERGTTTEEILAATGWPSVSVPAMAKAAKMVLSKRKEGRKTLYTARPMTDEEIAETYPPKVKRAKSGRGPAGRDPSTWSLMEYLAARGGINVNDPLIGDVRSLLGKKNHFIPGFGQLIRPTGASLDDARQFAIDAKYAFDWSDKSGGQATFGIDNLLQMMEEEARGNKQYIAGQEPKDARKDEHDEAVAEQLEHDLHADLEQAGIDPASVSGTLRNRVLQMMMREDTSPLDAYERAVMETTQDAAETGEVERIPDKIPDWDVADDFIPGF